MIRLIVCYKMRYCQEIETLFRISQKYDNNTKALHDVLSNLKWRGNWESNDLASLGHKLTQLAALARRRSEPTKFILNCYQHTKVYSEVCNKHPGIPDKTLPADFQEKILTQLRESDIQVDIYDARVKQLRKEVKATLIACGHCDPAYFLPYLEEGNQDQIGALKLLLQWIYLNGRSHCSNPTVIETEATTELPNMPLDSKVIENEAPPPKKNDMETVDLKTQDTQIDPKQKPMPVNVIEFEAPKNNMMTVDLKTQDTQLDPKQKPMPENVIESEAPKNDMVTVDSNTQDTQLNPKPNPMPKKTMTPRYKFKRIKKGGKVQKIQSPGFHKMNFDPSQKNYR